MKTQLSKVGLKNFIVTAIVAGSLNIAVQAQPRLEKESKKPVADEQMALNDLNKFSASLTNSVMYKVPEELVDPAVQDLEMMASVTMEEILYKAPEVSENETPVTEDNNMVSLKTNRKPVKVEVFRSPNEEWLINAGYYKANRTPAWHKIRKAVASKNHDKQLASEF